MLLQFPQLLDQRAEELYDAGMLPGDYGNMMVRDGSSAFHDRKNVAFDEECYCAECEKEDLRRKLEVYCRCCAANGRCCGTGKEAKKEEREANKRKKKEKKERREKERKKKEEEIEKELAEKAAQIKGWFIGDEEGEKVNASRLINETSGINKVREMGMLRRVESVDQKLNQSMLNQSILNQSILNQSINREMNMRNTQNQSMTLADLSIHKQESYLVDKLQGGGTTSSDDDTSDLNCEQNLKPKCRGPDGEWLCLCQGRCREDGDGGDCWCVGFIKKHHHDKLLQKGRCLKGNEGLARGSKKITFGKGNSGKGHGLIHS
jgi:hypothetical protein